MSASRSGTVFLARLRPICLAGFAVLASTALSFDEFPYDLRLIRSLSEAGMSDYAALQVDRMLKAYPDRKDLIMLAKAQMLYAEGKRTAGDEIVGQIAKGSPYYGNACLVKAEVANKRQDFKAAAIAYQDYFSTNPKPLSPQEDDIADYLEKVFTYAQAQVEMGDPAGAAKAIDYAKAVEGDKGLSEAQVIYHRGRMALAAYDTLESRKEAINAENVKAVIKQLDDLQQRMEYLLTMESQVEVAHAYLLIDQPETAIEKLKALSELLGAIKDSKDIRPKDSPVAGAYYYFGRARKAQAQIEFKKGDKEKARKLLQVALKKFAEVKDDYGDSPFGAKALVDYGKVRKLLEQMGEQFEDQADDGSALISLQQADKFFSQKQYSSAIPLYLETIQAARTNRKTSPDAALRLVVCLGEEKRYAEAQAIASYLADVFPDSEATSNSLLQLGKMFYDRYQATTEPKEKEAMMDEAVAAWDRFVEVAPDNPQASEIAFLIAENGYRKASVAAEQAMKIAAKPEAEKAKSQARELYRSAIPKYERMITLFGGTPKGVRAQYKLGWIYQALEEPKPAAAAFVAYAQMESDPAFVNDRLEAKFRAGEQLMFSAAPTGAIPQFEELLKWVVAGNAEDINPNSEKAVKVREDASSFLGWSYDLSGEALRPAMDTIKDQVEALKETIKTDERSVKGLDKQVAETAASLQEVEKSVAALTEECAKPLPSPEADAKKEALVQLKFDTLSEAERSVQKGELDNMEKKLTVQYRDTYVQSAAGEKSEAETQRTTVFSGLQMAKTRLADLEAEMKRFDEQLKDDEAEFKATAKEADALAAEYDVAKKAIVDLDAELAAEKGKFEEAKKKFESGDDAQKADARAAGQAARDAIRQLQDRLAQAKATVDDLERSQTKSERLKAQREKAMLAGRLDQVKGQIKQRQQEKSLTEAETALLEAKLKALNLKMSRADMITDLVKKSAAERSQPEVAKAWQTLQGEGTQLAAQLGVAAKQKADLKTGFVQVEIAALQREMAEADKKIEELNKQLEPLKKEFDRLKKLAQTSFEKFLAEYPKSRQVPDNMARLGTILIEFGNYGEAEKYLNQLAKDYPDHKALRMAMFNLGKVQFEIGKKEEAAAAFTKILTEVKDQSAANLNYMVKALVDTQYADLAVKASEELLRRSEDPNHPDYEKLSGKGRDNLLFRAGSAAVNAKQYKKAVAFLSTLTKENAKTAHFYESNLMIAKASRLSSPMDSLTARKALDEVLRYAQDEVVKTRARLELADLAVAEDTEVGTQRALGTLGQVIYVGEGKVDVFGDEADPESRALLEKAFLLTAKCYALLGDQTERDLVVSEYRRKFPAGAYSNEMSNLPAAKYKKAMPTPVPGK